MSAMLQMIAFLPVFALTLSHLCLDLGKGASWVMTHMDVVPPGERSFWSADPYLAYEKEGRIFGRGTEDNQQDLVASIFAAKACIDEGISHSSTIRLAFAGR